MRNMTTIKITECYGEHDQTVSTHRTACTEQAIERAIAKRYGRRVEFRLDNGLLETYPRVRFGQAFRPISGTCSLTSVTYRLCIVIL